MKSSFSERLKELRKENNLSQGDLAKALNYKITRSAIGLWEANKRDPGLSIVVMIAEYFNVTLDYMAGLTD